MAFHDGRGRRLRVIAVLTATLVAAPAASANEPLPETTEAYGAVLKDWAARHKVQRAIVVVRREGRIVYRSGVGGADPTTPVHLASLSKAITGACVATLIRDGKLAFDTPLSASLAKFFAVNGRPADPRLPGVTIAQLLTHRAGFAGNPDHGDLVTGPNLAAYLRVNSAKEPAKPALLATAFKTKLLYAPGTKNSYSNTGYLALGAIIEEATGKPYLDYCRGAVLAPVGVTGDMEPAWRVLGSFGGWRISGDAYLPILDLFAATDTRLGSVAKAWMLTPEGKGVAADSAVWYGLGTNVRKADGGVNVWHWGSWRYNMTKAKDGVLRSDFATFAVRASDGTAWFVQATPRIGEGEARRELDRGLFEAYRAVKRWN
jgi:CubicO group peptidase (beta-lactamase class C family)